MNLLWWFRQLARYNRVANERLYAACAVLDDAEYRKQRPVSFGSIHGLLNHILLGDRIWMARFEGGGRTTPALGTVLFDNFADLRSARTDEDERIENFFSSAGDDLLLKPLTYVNSQGVEYTDITPVAAGHFFNHATHHRGQVHAMLAHAGVPPPALDLHRIMNA